MPPSMVMSVSGFVSAGTGLSCKVTTCSLRTMQVLLPGLRRISAFGIRGEFLAGFQDERPVEVINIRIMQLRSDFYEYASEYWTGQARYF